MGDTIVVHPDDAAHVPLAAVSTRPIDVANRFTQTVLTFVCTELAVSNATIAVSDDWPLQGVRITIDAPEMRQRHSFVVGYENFATTDIELVLTDLLQQAVDLMLLEEERNRP